MKQFVKLLIIQGEAELDIELTRQELCSQKLFEPLTAFRRLDQSNSGRLRGNEFYEFLKDNSESMFKKSSIDLLVQYFDFDKDGVVTYKDFIKCILPQEHPELSELAMLKTSYQLEKNVLLPLEVEKLLYELLICILEWREAIEQIKNSVLLQNYQRFLDYLFAQKQSINIKLYFHKIFRFYDLVTEIQPVKQETLLSCFKFIDQDKSGHITQQDVHCNLLQTNYLKDTSSLPILSSRSRKKPILFTSQNRLLTYQY